MTDDRISTCAESLLNPGICCEPNCTNPATVAALRFEPSGEAIEHTDCDRHQGTAAATKPLKFDPIWVPSSTLGGEG